MKLQECSFAQIKTLSEQLQSPTWESDALIRKVMIAEFGDDRQIFALALCVKMIPLLIEMVEFAEMEKQELWDKIDELY